ncbi:hypothetical protein POJ06DRAFT_296039 [Lipomyces tetrasporus]|uniref:HNH nuclease domain-containing protein n=1 Tax=Lipomyces tetrasporus TaxID=54092 RepID=A0AAD7QRT1_9ASCO|nr:uncharacterized protein POJ06DRAFT_296039 [Lipomyces tetrasporus]KAJ8100155.1 hypothetical protein POJ06DRAFT_296039 [Lipomyces tetrasporus]
MTELDYTEKTLTETLITILEPCEVLLAFDYHNRTFDVRPIAAALLRWGYDRDSLADDLWKRATDSLKKIEILRKLLSPCDAHMVLPSPESGFVPRRPRTWQESDDLRAFLFGSIVTMMAPSRTPTPSDRSTATRNQTTFRRKLLDRDGVVSLIGKVRDIPSPRPPPGTTYFSSATLQGAHIIPFSASSHAGLRKALSIFAGQSVETLLTGSQINDPSNGLLLDPTTHSSFGSFHFGIEYRDKIYRLRKLYPDIDLPEVISRAIGYVVRESNAFQTILAILEDEEEFNSGNTGGDYWLVTGASYVERKLRGLVASNYSDTAGPDEEERLGKDNHVISSG